MAEALLSRRAGLSKADAKEIIAALGASPSGGDAGDGSGRGSDGGTAVAAAAASGWAPDEISPVAGVAFGPAANRLAGSKGRLGWGKALNALRLASRRGSGEKGMLETRPRQVSGNL